MMRARVLARADNIVFIVSCDLLLSVGIKQSGAHLVRLHTGELTPCSVSYLSGLLAGTVCWLFQLDGTISALRCLAAYMPYCRRCNIMYMHMPGAL